MSLLEKAYAKLHGNYEAFEGRLFQDALVDLTGGAGEEIDVGSARAQIDLLQEMGSGLSCCILRMRACCLVLGAHQDSTCMLPQLALY